MKTTNLLLCGILLFAGIMTATAQKKYSKSQIKKLKAEVEALVEANHKQTQVMVDKIFSFAELGFQEEESSKYLTGILEENGWLKRTGLQYHWENFNYGNFNEFLNTLKRSKRKMINRERDFIVF